jgi:hypothetical protein
VIQSDCSNIVHCDTASNSSRTQRESAEDGSDKDEVCFKQR